MNLKNGIEKLVKESQPKRKYPRDIIEGFKKLGWDESDLDYHFNGHKDILTDPDAPERVITDDQVYSYMRDHLRDGLIYPKKNVKVPQRYLNIKDDASYYEDLINKLGFTGAVQYGDGLDRGKVFADDTTLQQLKSEIIDTYGIDLDISERF